MAKQSERLAATRAAILRSARDLFGADGFANTSVDAIASGAGVAKGAVYHHFPTKDAIFEAVLDDVSAELAGEIAQKAASQKDPLTGISIGTKEYFSAVTHGPVGRIILADGPTVLGWERWRTIDLRHFGGGFPNALRAAMDRGLVTKQPVEPLASLLLGAVAEAARACAVSPYPAATAKQFERALKMLLDGLRTPQPSKRQQTTAPT